ncbi:MAG: TMEM165/GDT1 family protein [Mycobacteriales bacterium]
MALTVFLATFPVIVLGELPDKTMFATLLLATRGSPLAVWLGAAAAFTVHVAIAVSAGSLLALAPHRVVAAVVAALFVAGAAYLLLTKAGEQQSIAEAELARAKPRRHAAFTAFGVIFLAEWGDLTQVLTADLAARFRDPLAVAGSALAALLLTAALGVLAGARLARLPLRPLRWVTAAVLLVLAGLSAISAAG